MNGLNLNLRNYKAVAEAPVELSGLTVLAGVNASGKSTVARLFHSVVQGFSNYDLYAADACVASSQGKVLFAVLKYLVEVDALPENPLEKLWAAVQGRLVEEFIGKLAEAKTRVLGTVAEEYAPQVMLNVAVRWGIEVPQNGDLHALIIPLFDNLIKFYENRHLGANQKAVVAAALKGGAGWSKQGESSQLMIAEGEFCLFDSDGVVPDGGRIYSLQRSVYIDSPGATDFTPLDQNRLQVGKDVYKISAGSLENDRFSSDFLSMVQQMIGGVVRKNNPLSGVPGTWLFSDAGNRYVIPLIESAEGIKSVAPLIFLEKAGLLSAGTLLIIDEPETHQHPQWIVAYARLLVWLVKVRKVCILLASHSAYLVRALNTIAANEGCLDQLRFYLAESSVGGYRFVDKGASIADIFKVFNVALRETAIYQE